MYNLGIERETLAAITFLLASTGDVTQRLLSQQVHLRAIALLGSVFYPVDRAPDSALAGVR